MNLIDSLKAKAEADRQKAEVELPLLAERVAHGSATEKEVSEFVAWSGKSLDDVQLAVDRQHEIDRLKDLADLFRERSLAAYRLTLEAAKHRTFRFKTIAALEAETNRLRGFGWQIGMQANESRDAFRQLSEMTGQPCPIPNLAEDYRALDAEFAVVVVAEAVAVPVVSEPAETVVSEEPSKPFALPQRQRKSAEPVELPIAS